MFLSRSEKSGLSAIFIPGVHKFQVSAAFDLFQPRAVALVPVHGFRKAFFKGAGRGKAKFRGGKRKINGVAPVVPGAVLDEADEIDIVLHIGALKDGNAEYVTDEIAAVKEAIGDHVLKVIIETCLLTEEEKILACECVTKGGADYIKTSTGFSTKGADLSDIALFKKHIGKNVKIKAAGGIHTKKEMEDFLAAGCDRIGASGAVKAYLKEKGM